MFKKSLMALALIGAAAAAQAGNVQVYGVVDAGVDYNKTKVSGDAVLSFEKASFKVNESSTKLATGKHSGNRFGIKGTEEIAPNIKAGFVLEGGFDLLNGDMADKGKLFNRQADLFIEGDFGHIAFGRVGTLTSANGTYGILGQADNFAGGWGDHIGAAKNVFVSSGRIDNSVTYMSPEVAGAKLYAQYSFNQKGEQKDKLHENDRYTAIGATYKFDNLELVGVFDKTFYNDNKVIFDKDDKKKDSKIKDRWSLNLGGSYDFEVVKVFALYQHAAHSMDFGGMNGSKAYTVSQQVGPENTEFFKALAKINAVKKHIDNVDSRRFDMMLNQGNGLKSDSIAIGLDAPIGKGTIKAQVHYGRAKLQQAYNGNSFITGFNAKIRSTGMAVGYEHNLSKRTQLYIAGAYDHSKIDVHMDKFALLNNVASQVKMNTFEAVAGLVHKF